MRIAAGAWRLETAPARGGAVLSLTFRDWDILRPTPAEASDPLDFACFPLVPYVNRIAFGSFDWNGAAYRIASNHPRQAHPLHGVGWLESWTVVRACETSVSMQLDHAADDSWPWRFTATQVFALSGAGLTARLEITSTDDAIMPVSLGFHPYFVRDSATTLAFAARGVWLTDDHMLPTEHAAADRLGDWLRSAPLERTDLIDHCYTGWDGRATIRHPAGDVTIEAEGTPATHLYVPPGEDYFCLEPVTAMPDAVNRGVATALAPGESLGIAMRVLSRQDPSRACALAADAAPRRIGDE